MVIRDLLTLCDFYTKKKNVKDKNEIYDESILVPSKQKNGNIFNQNESQSKLLGPDYSENESEGDPKSTSMSPLRQAAIHNYLEDELSLIEKTAQRVKPIIKAL